MKKIILFLSLCLTAANVYAGSIQLSTYYPSPFGYYERLKFNPRTSLSEPCEPGTVYYLAGTGLRYCAEDTLWKSMGGGVWTQSVNDIYPLDTATNPNLKVGIGTTAPLGGIGLHLKTSQWTYGTAAGMIIQAATAGDSPGLLFFDSNNKEKGALGVASLVSNYSNDAQIGDMVLRATNGRLIFTTENISGPPYPPPPVAPAHMLIDQSGNVGIGTTTPEFKLTVDNDGGILAKGTIFSGTTLTTSGAGARLIWYPRKGAFRAGNAQSTEWDDVNIGDASVAMGDGTRASGLISTALGRNTTASGISSTAMGSATTASSEHSTAMGLKTTASGFSSTAMGDNTIASNLSSTAMGSATTASGRYSVAMGLFTTSQAAASTVLGRYNIISGNPILWIDTDPLFVIGNGTDDANRTNAMTVFKNGNVGIGTTAPTAKLEVAGQIKATGGTLIYQCPNGDPDWNRNQCVSQLSANPTCTYVDGGGEYTANCALVGRMVAP